MLYGNGSICKVTKDGSSCGIRMELMKLKDQMKACCSERIRTEKKEILKVKELATGKDQDRKGRNLKDKGACYSLRCS